jgi:hypothetical protein
MKELSGRNFLATNLIFPDCNEILSSMSLLSITSFGAESTIHQHL